MLNHSYISSLPLKLLFWYLQKMFRRLKCSDILLALFWIPMLNLHPLTELDSVTLEEVGKILRTVSVPTYLLDPDPFWIVKIVWEVTCGWIHSMLLSYLRDRIAFPSWRGQRFVLFLRSTVPRQLPSNFQSSVLEKANE